MAEMMAIYLVDWWVVQWERTSAEWLGPKLVAQLVDLMVCKTADSTADWSVKQ